MQLICKNSQSKYVQSDVLNNISRYKMLTRKIQIIYIIKRLPINYVYLHSVCVSFTCSNRVLCSSYLEEDILADLTYLNNVIQTNFNEPLGSSISLYVGRKETKSKSTLSGKSVSLMVVYNQFVYLAYQGNI